MNKKTLTTTIFIERAIKIHGSEYDYSNTVYQGMEYPISIACKLHGLFNLKHARTHLKNSSSGGCRQCAYEKSIPNGRGDTDLFIKKAKKIHNDKFDYSRVNYIGALDKVTIICPHHGEFNQRPNDHLTGYGCNKCRPNAHLTLEDFIAKAKLAHGSNPRYDYSLVEYKNRITPVTILCPTHGSFTQKPEAHFKGSGCPKCQMSKGESLIYGTLAGLELNFQYQYTFDDCKSDKNRVLRFDFYVPSHKLLIEYDGRQHYEKATNHPCWNSESIERAQQHDVIKNQYANYHNIKLLRIPYWEYKNIKNILVEVFG